MVLINRFLKTGQRYDLFFYLLLRIICSLQYNTKDESKTRRRKHEKALSKLFDNNFNLDIIDNYWMCAQAGTVTFKKACITENTAKDK